jgi:hypothetical protein
MADKETFNEQPSVSLNGSLQPAVENRILQAIGQASMQKDLNKSLLRLTHLLQQCALNFF